MIKLDKLGIFKQKYRIVSVNNWNVMFSNNNHQKQGRSNSKQLLYSYYDMATLVIDVLCA